MVPTNKKELIFEITSTYQKLRADLEDIPEELTKLYELEGHAKGKRMSICNLISYLIGWSELVLKWHRIKGKGKEPDFPETGYKWNELGKLAQKFYADYSCCDYKTLLNKLDASVKKVLKLVENKTDKQLYCMPWYTKWTMGRMIQFNTSSPYKNARNRISKWKKQRKIKSE
jgi:hypothetical protein